MKVLGITGPTGAGKTTALQVLEELGVEIIDADGVYHRLLSGSGEMRAALIKAFGPEVLDEEMQIDRKKLAEAVYPDRLAELNAITHPFVVTEVDRILSGIRKTDRAAAIDAIALVESGLAKRCDAVVAVTAPLEERIRRIMARDGIDESYARRRALHQQGEDFFRRHADFVLENGSMETRESFRDKAMALFERLLAQDRKKFPKS